MSGARERRSDAGIDDLLSLGEEPTWTVEDAPARSPLWWWVLNGLLVAAATAATVAGLRVVGVRVPVLLVVAAFVALRVVHRVLDDVAPPPLPRPRRRSGADGDPPGAALDGLRAAAGRWERLLVGAHADPERFSRTVLPVLTDLCDERLRQRHGISRVSEPQRARQVLGEPLWRLLAGLDRPPTKVRELAAHLETLEKL